MGNTVNINTPLGEHTISVIVNTLASGTFQSSQSVTVSDNISPELNILFIDRRSGKQVTEVSGNRKHYIIVRYDVVDTCDLGATARGVAVPVHAVENGDAIIIKNRKFAAATLGTSAVNVSAEATDDSGNRRHREATLIILD